MFDCCVCQLIAHNMGIANDDAPHAVSLFFGSTFVPVEEHAESDLCIVMVYRFVDEGLFRYCRHPNYFGEMLLWTSLTALAGGPGVLAAHPWVAVSPAFTIFLLTQASGACSHICQHFFLRALPRSGGMLSHPWVAHIRHYSPAMQPDALC